MFLKNNIYLLFIFILSCQPVEIIPLFEIDISRFDKISFNAKKILINNKYNPIFSDENIEDQIENTPIKILENWIENNISIFGNENKLIINIIDASIVKKEIENEDAKKYEEKTVFHYEVFYLVEYELYDDSDFIIANTTVESTRSTTSQKYISLNESDIIINDLLNNSLKDFTKESKSLTKIYMSEYLK